MAQGEADHWAAEWRALSSNAAERAADHAKYVGFIRDLVALLERDVADSHAYFGIDWPPKIARLRSLADSLSQPATDDGYKALVLEAEAELGALLVVGSGHDLTEGC